MKTSELFEIKKSREREVTVYFDPKTHKHVPNGMQVVRPNYYPAEYKETWGTRLGKDGKVLDGKRNVILGTVGDWLDKMGAGREHFAAALKKVRSSPEYKHAIHIGFVDETNAADEKNCTITLTNQYQGVIGGDTRETPVSRKILANGNIRTMAAPRAFHGGRGSADHPHTVDTHPHMDPVDRIANSMRASIERVCKIYQVQSKRYFVKSLHSEKS